MNYAGIIKSDTANGLGIRLSIFVSGCNNRCNGCFNDKAWDFDYGEPFTDKVKESIFEEFDRKPYNGLSILGGEPLDEKNIDTVKELLKEFKEKYPDKNIWLYTGYKFEYILKRYEDILKYIDIIVDGKFEISKKDMSLAFRGSSNQRIIDVKNSLESNEIINLEIE